MLNVLGKGWFYTKWVRGARTLPLPHHPLQAGHHTRHFVRADTSFVLPEEVSAHPKLRGCLMLCFFSFKYSWEQSGWVA